MSKTVDVDLRVRARNLASKSLAEINTEIGKLEKAQARQAKTADLAAASTKELVAQQQFLAAAMREIGRRRDLVRTFEDQQKQIGATAAKLRELTAAYAKMRADSRAGTALGLKEKDLKAGVREIANTKAQLERLISQAKNTKAALSDLGITDIAGDLTKLNNSLNRTEVAYKEATAAVDGQSAAMARQAAIQAEATRRQEAERASIERTVVAGRALAAENERIAQKRRDSIAAFSASNAATEREIAIRDRLVKFLNTERGQRILDAQAARKQATETDRNTQALNRNAVAARRAGDGVSFFADRGRKSLDVYQRIRGQVLGLASAYIGVFQAIQTFQNAIQATTRNQALKLGLSAVNNGDARAAAEDYAFLRKEADRLGFVFDDLAPKYAGMAAAGKAVGLSNQTIRNTFRDVATQVVGMNLSVDDAEGVFKAMVQIFSKARVQAEELRGQLGDRLPGAVVAFAKANDIALTDLDKKLKAGELGVAEIIKFVQQNAKQFTKPLEEGTVALQQNINRAKNAYNDFLRSLLSGANSEKIQTALTTLSSFFKSEEGKKFAHDLATAFGVAIDAFIFLAKHANEVMTIIKALLALQVLKFFVGIGTTVVSAASGIARFTGTLVKMFTAIRAGQGVVAALQLALGVGIPQSAAAAGTAVTGLISGPIAALLAIAAAGIIIPIIIQWREDKRVADTTANVDKFLLRTKTSLDQSSIALANARSPDTLRESIAAGEKAVKQLDLQIAKVKEVIDLNEKARKAVTNRQAANQDARMVARFGIQGSQDSRIAAGNRAEEEKTQRQMDLLAGLERQQQIVRQQIADAKKNLTEQEAAEAKRQAEELKRVAAQTAKGDADEKGKKKTAEQIQAELNRRLNAERAIQKEILQLDTDTLEARIRGEATTTEQIKANYDLRLRQIANEIQERRLQLERLEQDARTAGGDTSGINEARAKVDELEKVLQARAQEDMLVEGIRLKQEALNKLQAEQAAEIEAVNTLVELGLKTEVEGRRDVLAIQQQYRANILEAIAALRAALEALPPDLFARLGAKELITQLETAAVKATQVKTEFQLIAENLGGQFAQGVASAFGVLAKGIAGFLTGANSLKDAFSAAKDAFLNFAADFLVKIGEMILQAILLRAIQNAINGTQGGFIDAALGALHHEGGVVGESKKMRMVDPGIFEGARRFHEGGMPGLRSNEVPAILEKGEEVLTADDPRHVANGGMAAGAGASIGVDVINTIDSASFVEQGLNSRRGRKTLFNVIQADLPSFKKLLGIRG